MAEAGLKALVPGSFRIKLPADSANMGIKINQKAVSLPVVDGMLKVELQAGDQLVLIVLINTADNLYMNPTDKRCVFSMEAHSAFCFSVRL